MYFTTQNKTGKTLSLRSAFITNFCERSLRSALITNLCAENSPGEHFNVPHPAGHGAGAAQDGYQQRRVSPGKTKKEMTATVIDACCGGGQNLKKKGSGPFLTCKSSTHLYPKYRI